jgi:TetR/AcrR family transcriptional regulator, transcriptional repressor for nem operon
MGARSGVGSGAPQSRELILDAVLRLMFKAGYAGVTYRAVAAEAGVTSGLVQYYFPTQDDLFIATIRRGAGRTLEQLRSALDGADNPLRVIWEYSRDESTAVMTTEFLALGNHRRSVRAEIAEVGRKIRRVQLSAIRKRFGNGPVADTGLTPAALLFVLTGIPRMIQLEEGLGVASTHKEILRAADRFLAELESATAAETQA